MFTLTLKNIFLRILVLVLVLFRSGAFFVVFSSVLLRKDNFRSRLRK